MAMKLRVVKVAVFSALAFIVMAMPAQTAGSEENLASTSHDWTKFGYDLANTSYTSDSGPMVLSVRWRFPPEPYYLPREVFSWPAVVNGVVYAAGGHSVAETDWSKPFEYMKNSVFALSTENGDLIWYRDIGPFTSSSPTVANGTVFIASDHGNVYALNAENGDTIWERDLIPGTDDLMYDMSSPTVVDNKVLVATHYGYVYALRKENGEIMWEKKVDEHIGSSIAVENGKLFVASNGNGWSAHLSALNIENGEILWTYPFDNDLSGTSPTVAYIKVFAVTTKGRVYSVYAENEGLCWKYEFGDEEHYVAYGLGAPAAAYGMIYVFKNRPGENVPTYVVHSPLKSLTNF